MKQAALRKIYFVLNGKGGVGKSFFATNFVQYLKDHNVTCHAVDTDNENSTLKRYHPEAQYIRVDDAKHLDQIFDTEHAVTVVDCRAASTDILLRYFGSLNIFDALVELHAELTIISPINHEADSVQQLRLLSEQIGSKCDYIIVKNCSHSERFEIYETSKVRARLVGELNAQEIVMPRMMDWLVTALNKHTLTVTEATSHSTITLLDRQRLKIWQRSLYTELDRVISKSVTKAKPESNA